MESEENKRLVELFSFFVNRLDDSNELVDILVNLRKVSETDDIRVIVDAHLEISTLVDKYSLRMIEYWAGRRTANSFSGVRDASIRAQGGT